MQRRQQNHQQKHQQEQEQQERREQQGEDKDYEIGTIAAQCLTEPLTQAALSSFHFMGEGGPGTERDALAEFNKILSGNFDEIRMDIDCELFNPFDMLYINFYDFSKMTIKKTGADDDAWGLRLVNAGLASTKYPREVVSLVVSEQCIYPLPYLCFYLQKFIQAFDIVPSCDGNIDIMCGREHLTFVSNIVYNTASNRTKTKIKPLSFDLEAYVSAPAMSVLIADCDVKELAGAPGVTSFEFCNFSKILKYNGIEYLRDVIKERLVPIVDDSPYSNLLADYMTYSGRFESTKKTAFLDWLRDIEERGADSYEDSDSDSV
ncbi:hypothetical protein EC988_000006 [Linderina pennispora]|nr:hypothetical protein EC988_000006 [Linderina pennispora]